MNLKSISLSEISDAAMEIIRKAHLPARQWRNIGEPQKMDHPGWSENRDKVVAQIGRGMLVAVIGNRGTGKTQIAIEAVVRAATLYTVTRQTSECLYCSAMEIFLAIKSTYDNGSKNEETAIKTYVRPAMLVIDEMQERGETQWEDRLLTYILDKRYQGKKDTILISNLKRDAFLQSVGSSVVSRLSETGGIIECTWKSFREQKC